MRAGKPLAHDTRVRYWQRASLATLPGHAPAQRWRARSARPLVFHESAELGGASRLLGFPHFPVGEERGLAHRLARAGDDVLEPGVVDQALVPLMKGILHAAQANEA